MRGYRLEDAQAVLDSRPTWIWQNERIEHDEFGSVVRTRPARWRLVGRGFFGVILAVVVELPRDDGVSEVVTIYEASPKDQSRYYEDLRGRR